MLPPSFHSAAAFAKGGDREEVLWRCLDSVSAFILAHFYSFSHRRMSQIECDDIHKFISVYNGALENKCLFVARQARKNGTVTLFLRR
jgi:hypothetical protein